MNRFLLTLILLPCVLSSFAQTGNSKPVGLRALQGPAHEHAMFQVAFFDRSLEQKSSSVEMRLDGEPIIALDRLDNRDKGKWVLPLRPGSYQLCVSNRQGAHENCDTLVLESVEDGFPYRIYVDWYSDPTPEQFRQLNIDRWLLHLSASNPDLDEEGRLQTARILVDEELDRSPYAPRDPASGFEVLIGIPR